MKTNPENMNANFKEQMAIFTEWNPNPIIELNLQGEIIYLNLASRAQFSTLNILGNKHPVIEEVNEQIIYLINNKNEFIVLAREIDYFHSIYEQHIFAIPGKSSIFIYMNDITVRKKAENQIIKFNHDLEKRVLERTQQLQAINEELLQ